MASLLLPPLTAPGLTSCSPPGSLCCHPARMPLAGEAGRALTTVPIIRRSHQPTRLAGDGYCPATQMQMCKLPRFNFG